MRTGGSGSHLYPWKLCLGSSFIFEPSVDVCTLSDNSRPNLFSENNRSIPWRWSAFVKGLPEEVTLTSFLKMGKDTAEHAYWDRKVHNLSSATKKTHQPHFQGWWDTKQSILNDFNGQTYKERWASTTLGPKHLGLCR